MNFLQRVCGSCTACCKTHAVTLFKKIKKPGQWCPHCEVGEGCLIYENRPDECKKFKCNWLRGGGEENCRPDRVKIVLDFVDIKIMPQVLLIWEVNGGELRKGFAKSWAEIALEDYGISVGLMHLSGRREFIPGIITLPKEMEQQLKRENFRIVLRRK